MKEFINTRLSFKVWQFIGFALSMYTLGFVAGKMW